MFKDILKKNGFKEEDYSFYGDDIVKIKDIKKKTTNAGKIVLITSTSPTKSGEGKTTLAISISDALNKLGEKAIVALREPSLGPVFGLKGGATGGGKAKVLPEEEINLHFTGDFHAITSANNLLSAIIDNHIYQGNDLQITSITHERCLDINDRSLRHLTINNQETSFNITPASEIMAILCLAQDATDLKKRLGEINVGFTKDGNLIKAKDLKCVNALYLLLKKAIYPNLVKTSENNLAIIHGGPFANIAHGTNSVIATRYAKNNFPFSVVEAGFGSDMGALKYYDIVVRNNPDLKPDVVVLNTTIMGLKYQGNGSLENGISNLLYHLKNMLKLTNNLIVVLNKYASDNKEDIAYLKKYVEDKNVFFSISEGYLKGSEGSLDVARKIIDLSENEPKEFEFNYDLKDDLETKIKKFCQTNYGTQEIIYTPDALTKLKKFNNLEYPICIAKTPNSITDDAKILGYPKNFKMTVKDIKFFSGAGFITIYFGNILTMPGLTKEANYLKMEE